jgi:hypothetical protein
MLNRGVTSIIAAVIWMLVLVKVSRRCVENLFGLIHPQECKNQCLLGLMESTTVTILLGK